MKRCITVLATSLTLALAGGVGTAAAQGFVPDPIIPIPSAPDQTQTGEQTASTRGRRARSRTRRPSLTRRASAT